MILVEDPFQVINFFCIAVVFDKGGKSIYIQYINKSMNTGVNIVFGLSKELLYTF